MSEMTLREAMGHDEGCNVWVDVGESMHLDHSRPCTCTPPAVPAAASTVASRYRVWVEKHESGWIEVSAANEEQARDRARDVADRDWWYPASSHATPLTVELLQATEQPLTVAAVDPQATSTGTLTPRDTSSSEF